MRKLPCLFALLFLLPALTLGQETTGNIDGSVKDKSAAAIPGVEVTAVHVATRAVRKTITTEDGAYVFTSLQVGLYEISAQLPGFKQTVQRGIELHIADHLRIDLVLEIGEIAEVVSVVAESVQVQTETSEVSGLISGDEVRELQLNGRSFMTLLELIPGVTSDMPDRADPNTNPSLSINGARSSASSFNIDGGSNMDVIVGSSSLNTFTSVDTVAEVKVATSTFAAEYGKGGFSQVNVVTRGGTRKFHGSVYEFFRNDAMDATDFFSHQVLPLKLNNFGFTFGGPLLLPGGYNRKRNKTFFFFTQEFNHTSTRGEAINTLVPSEDERKGDFRGRGPGADGVFGTADDPVIDPVTRLGFPGGVIPQSRIDPNGVKLLALYPLPNFRGPGNTNFTSAAPSLQRWREELVRIDHNFSPSFKLFGRYAQDGAFVSNPYGGSGLTSITTRFPGVATTKSDRPGRNLVVSSTQIFNPHFLNETSFTYAARHFTMISISELGSREHLGVNIPEIFPGNFGNVVPTINLGSGFAALNVPREGFKRLFNLEFSDNLTRIIGRHVFKAGVLYSYGGNLEHPFSPNTNGSFTFNTQFSRNPIANMLLGLPFSYTEIDQVVYSDARFSIVEAFAQDDFKVNRRLMLNVGLRYSAYLNPWDTNNVLTNFLPSLFDPNRAPRINPTTGQPVPGTGEPLNGIVIAGRDSPFGKRATQNNTDLLGPRLGFAWDVFGRKKTALRGGYGIFYTRPFIGTFINNAFDNPPFSRSVTIQTPRLNDPGGGVEAAQGVPNLTTLVTPMLAPTVQQWSLGVQQEILKRAILSVAYVGTHGTHLFRPLAINNPPPGLAAARGVHVNAVRPFLGYGSITQRESSASSIYHSLQVSFNRRMANKLSLSAAYTFSKSIDVASSERGGSDIPPDSNNVRAERGPSDFDRTHVFTSSYIWFLPGPARRGLAGALLNGWQLSGITRIYSGRPFDVVMTSDVAGIGSTQNQRPNVVGDTRGLRTIEQWFNRSAFARPATGTFGNMGRNSLRGPGIHKWDLSLFKNFQAGEKVRVQFRSEAFNAFNHPSLSGVGASLTTTSSGVNPNTGNFAVVTDTRDARVIQLALKILF
ncbi:MAG TPA: carboxypeptidase regulatory-like domain-containing protein [Acidobacteriota bacterium]|jgi:hypothetical protein